MIRSDSLRHLEVGSAIALYLIVVVLLAQRHGALAIAVGGTGACGFVEWYQRARGNGKAEWRDLVFGAFPSWGLAALLHFL